MKHFIALRKEKLDRVLNLATPKIENLNGLAGLDEETMHDISSNNDCAAKKEQQPVNKSIMTIRRYFL